MIFVKVENSQTYSPDKYIFDPDPVYIFTSRDYMRNIMEIMFKIGQWQKRFPDKRIDSVSFASAFDSNAGSDDRTVILGAGVIYHTENST